MFSRGGYIQELNLNREPVRKKPIPRIGKKNKKKTDLKKKKIKSTEIEKLKEKYGKDLFLGLLLLLLKERKGGGGEPKGKKKDKGVRSMKKRGGGGGGFQSGASIKKQREQEGKAARLAAIRLPKPNESPEETKERVLLETLKESEPSAALIYELTGGLSLRRSNFEGQDLQGSLAYLRQLYLGLEKVNKLPLTEENKQRKEQLEQESLKEFSKFSGEKFDSIYNPSGKKGSKKIQEGRGQGLGFVNRLFQADIMSSFGPSESGLGVGSFSVAPASQSSSAGGFSFTPSTSIASALEPEPAEEYRPPISSFFSSSATPFTAETEPAAVVEPVSAEAEQPKRRGRPPKTQQPQVLLAKPNKRQEKIDRFSAQVDSIKLLDLKEGLDKEKEIEYLKELVIDRIDQENTNSQPANLAKFIIDKTSKLSGGKSLIKTEKREDTGVKVGGANALIDPIYDTDNNKILYEYRSRKTGEEFKLKDAYPEAGELFDLIQNSKGKTKKNYQEQLKKLDRDFKHNIRGKLNPKETTEKIGFSEDNLVVDIPSIEAKYGSLSSEFKGSIDPMRQIGEIVGSGPKGITTISAEGYLRFIPYESVIKTPTLDKAKTQLDIAQQQLSLFDPFSGSSGVSDLESDEFLTNQDYQILSSSSSSSDTPIGTKLVRRVFSNVKKGILEQEVEDLKREKQSRVEEMRKREGDLSEYKQKQTLLSQKLKKEESKFLTDEELFAQPKKERVVKDLVSLKEEDQNKKDLETLGNLSKKKRLTKGEKERRKNLEDKIGKFNQSKLRKAEAVKRVVAKEAQPYNITDTHGIITSSESDGGTRTERALKSAVDIEERAREKAQKEYERFGGDKEDIAAKFTEKYYDDFLTQSVKGGRGQVLTKAQQKRVDLDQKKVLLEEEEKERLIQGRDYRGFVSESDFTGDAFTPLETTYTKQEEDTDVIKATKKFSRRSDDVNTRILKGISDIRKKDEKELLRTTYFDLLRENRRKIIMEGLENSGELFGEQLRDALDEIEDSSETELEDKKYNRYFIIPETQEEVIQGILDKKLKEFRQSKKFAIPKTATGTQPVLAEESLEVGGTSLLGQSLEPIAAGLGKDFGLVGDVSVGKKKGSSILDKSISVAPLDESISVAPLDESISVEKDTFGAGNIEDEFNLPAGALTTIGERRRDSSGDSGDSSVESSVSGGSNLGEFFDDYGIEE